VSSTLSGTGPQPAAVPAVPAAVPAAGDAPATAAPRSRPHIIAFDMIRLIIMVFVVSVHTLSFAGGRVTTSIGAVTTVFHTSRELFLLLTALVLTYNYGHRPLQVGRFLRRRFWLVLPAYITWTAIYYAANGHARGAFPDAFLKELLNPAIGVACHRVIAAVQIEIGVLADIGKCRLVGRRFIDDRELAVTVNPIGGLDRAIARIAGAAIGIDDLQDNAIDGMLDDRPVALGNVIAATMQM